MKTEEGDSFRLRVALAVAVLKRVSISHALDRGVVEAPPARSETVSAAPCKIVERVHAFRKMYWTFITRSATSFEGENNEIEARHKRLCISLSCLRCLLERPPTNEEIDDVTNILQTCVSAINDSYYPNCIDNKSQRSLQLKLLSNTCEKLLSDVVERQVRLIFTRSRCVRSNERDVHALEVLCTKCTSYTAAISTFRSCILLLGRLIDKINEVSSGMHVTEARVGTMKEYESLDSADAYENCAMGIESAWYLLELMRRVVNSDSVDTPRRHALHTVCGGKLLDLSIGFENVGLALASSITWETAASLCG